MIGLLLSIIFTWKIEIVILNSESVLRSPSMLLNWLSSPCSESDIVALFPVLKKSSSSKWHTYSFSFYPRDSKLLLLLCMEILKYRWRHPLPYLQKKMKAITSQVPSDNIQQNSATSCSLVHVQVFFVCFIGPGWKALNISV